MNVTRFASLLIILTLLTGCRKAKQNDPGAAPAVPAAAGRENTKHYERLVAGKEDDGDKADEARAWLDPKNKSNVLWKTSRAQTTKWVEELYAAGATKVLAIYSPKDKEVPINMCAQLLIVLPTDAEARKKVLKAYNRIDKELWGDDHTKEKDDGQKYIELNMDP
ncbi:MAG TPA: hypothetical protein PLN21_13785 [Gemmatales bacterium]|nr:hypothetical protein [Gemmatales bacterium]